MTASPDTRKRMKVIHRISKAFPDETLEERRKLVEGIVSGELDPVIPRPAWDRGLAKRLADGQASRSPRAADKRKKPEKPKKKAEPKPEPGEEPIQEPKKHKRGKDHDRKEEGGIQRSEGFNL